MRTVDLVTRESTEMSEDGCTVYVCLRVDRRDYEFARSWVEFHAVADPDGTVEGHLEGYLNTALARAISQANWRPSAAIQALYPTVSNDHREDVDFPF